LPEVWAESNPGFNDIVAEDDFTSAVLRTPEAEFKTKRLNIWTSTSDAWLPHGTWDAVADNERAIEDGSNNLLINFSWGA
jgi:phage terminase large subunit-like protein